VPRDMTLPDGWTWASADRYATKIVHRIGRRVLDWHDVKATANHAVAEACRYYRPERASFKTFLHNIATQLGRLAVNKAGRHGITIRAAGKGRRITPADLPRKVGMFRAKRVRANRSGSAAEYEEMLSILCPQTRRIFEMIVEGYTIEEVVEAMGLKSKAMYHHRKAAARQVLIAAGYGTGRASA
jgi:DNA-directed RNA polymerase specialized sigma24 family protein